MILLGSVILDAFLLIFFLPVLQVELPSSAWYPYDRGYQGLGSISYGYLGYGGVYWYPNHYWVYFGPTVLQLSNSSDSYVTLRSVDQHGASIFGYYAIFSDSAGRIISTGYTTISFPAVAGRSYTVQIEGFGSCTFEHWSTGATSSGMVVTATSGGHTYTAVFNC